MKVIRINCTVMLVGAWLLTRIWLGGKFLCVVLLIFQQSISRSKVNFPVGYTLSQRGELFLFSLFSLTTTAVTALCKYENTSCFSSEGEEEQCGGPTEAAPVRDGANRQDVWGPRDNSTDAVHKVRSTCQRNTSLITFLPILYYSPDCSVYCL